jgi:hypothetical protein
VRRPHGQLPRGIRGRRARFAFLSPAAPVSAQSEKGRRWPALRLSQSDKETARLSALLQHENSNNIALNFATDDEGIELSGLDAARANAMASAREMVADNVRSDSGHPMETLFVTDESGRELLSISAIDVLPPTIR